MRAQGPTSRAPADGRSLGGRTGPLRRSVAEIVQDEDEEDEEEEEEEDEEEEEEEDDDEDEEDDEEDDEEKEERERLEEAQRDAQLVRTPHATCIGPGVGLTRRLGSGACRTG